MFKKCVYIMFVGDLSLYRNMIMETYPKNIFFYTAEAVMTYPLRECNDSTSDNVGSNAPNLVLVEWDSTFTAQISKSFVNTSMSFRTMAT